MATRSVRAYVHNDTSMPLVKVSDECPHGEWTTRAPDRIEAHSTVMMRVAAIAFGGVESRAKYRIGANESDNFYVHWNNPTFGSTDYHTYTAPGTYSFWSGPRSGSDPTVHFFLRPAGKVETDFAPDVDGFKFGNYWDNAPYTLPPLRGTLLDQKYGNAHNGLCGGMVLTALDYFVAQQEIPATTKAPEGEQDLLFLHLVDRLFDTFSVNSVSLMLKLMNPFYPDGDENVLGTLGMANGRADVMAHQEWPLIRADLDAGLPSPICVITVKSLNPGDLGHNHQVLGYAYEANGHDVKVYVYDPNQPGKNDIYMKFTDGDVSNRIVVEHNIAVETRPIRPIYCFIRMENKTKPVPFNTRPRLTASQRRARRVRIERQDQEVLSKSQVSQRRGTYPVLPDCGEREFNCVVYAVRIRSTFVVTTPYYRDPVLVWRINGLVVQPGQDRELKVPAEAERPDEAPEGPPATGLITLRISLNANKLEVLNDPQDGNYSLSVQVEAKDRGDETLEPQSSTAVCEVVGLELVVDGWAEANAACFKDYLDRHRSGPPLVSAVAEALYAQSGRPPDPLWDPDPAALKIGTLVAQADPTFANIATWKNELRAESMTDGPASRAWRRKGAQSIDLTGVIEMEVSGISVRVGQGVDRATLESVLKALRAPR